ncbi:MAG: ATP-grasp domain-containing protein [Candidatus Thorarchaeota archaeon]
MKIFIQEYVSGGGLSQQTLLPDFLIEGFGMLRSLIENFSRLNFDIVTTLDYRIKFLENFLDASSVHTITESDDISIKSLKLLSECDYFLVIAPSTEKIMSNLVSKYEKITKSLNCNVDTIDFLVEKKNLNNLIAKNNFNYPKSYLYCENQIIKLETGEIFLEADFEELISRDKLNFPLIWKPNIGDACENLSVIYTKEQLQFLLEQKSPKQFLLQEFIDGENLSATIFVKDSNIQILSINRQIIDLEFGKSKYSGGITNINSSLKKEIESNVIKLLSKINGLNGLIGVDFILTKKNDKYKIYFIEINPRATAPICGIFNKYMSPIDLTKYVKNRKIKNNKSCFFAKKEFSTSMKIPSQSYQKLKLNNSIITPPIEFQPNNFLLLFRGFGESELLAEKDFKVKFQALLEKINQ